MKWDKDVGVKEDIQWRNIDLNLLVTFSYLYRHRSVSVAAEKRIEQGELAPVNGNNKGTSSYVSNL